MQLPKGRVGKKRGDAGPEGGNVGGFPVGWGHVGSCSHAMGLPEGLGGDGQRGGRGQEMRGPWGQLLRRQECWPIPTVISSATSNPGLRTCSCLVLAKIRSHRPLARDTMWLLPRTHSRRIQRVDTRHDRIGRLGGTCGFRWLEVWPAAWFRSQLGIRFVNASCHRRRWYTTPTNQARSDRVIMGAGI